MTGLRLTLHPVAVLYVLRSLIVVYNANNKSSLRIVPHFEGHIKHVQKYSVNVKMEFELLHEDYSHTKSVVGLSYSPGGRLLASSGADKKITIYDAQSGHISVTLEGEHTMGINSSVWIDDALLASVSDDRTIKVWDGEQGKVISTFKTQQSAGYSLAINPVNKVLLCGCINGSVVMHHLSTRDAVGGFIAQADAVVSIESHPDGMEILTGGQEGNVRLWDSAHLGMCYQTIVTQYNQHKPTPLSCASYTPNASYILASSLNSTHRLIPLDYNHPQATSASSASDQQHMDAHGDGIADVASTAGSVAENSRPVVQYAGHLNEKYSISSRIWSTTQGNYLLSGSEDGMAYAWDLDSATVVGTTTAKQGAVLAVAYSSAQGLEDQVATAGTDGSVMLWRCTATPAGRR